MNLKLEYNSPDVKNGYNQWIKSYTDEFSVKYITRAGLLWNSINQRCRVGSSHQNERPTYIGCTNGFKNFQEFAEWCQHQYGYMNKEDNGRFWHLDKDLKVFGNKIYSPETCIFVPNRINSLQTIRSPMRGTGKIGVTWDKNTNRFKSQCSNGFGKQKHLGHFNCELEAHQAWQRYRIDMIRRIIVEDEEIRNHLELVPILLAQAARIEHDVLNNIETK